MKTRIIAIISVLLLGQVTLICRTALGDSFIAGNVQVGDPFEFNDYEVAWRNVDGVISQILRAEVAVSGDELAVTRYGSVALANHPIMAPRIQGNTAVWMDCGSGNADVYYKYRPFEVNGPFWIPSPGDQWFPSVYGDNVMWWDLRSGKGFEVYGYNLSTSTEFVIPTGPLSVYPYAEIWEQTVIWKHSTTQIGVCDIRTMDWRTIDVAADTTVVNAFLDIHDYVAVWYTSTVGPNAGEAFHVYDLRTDEERLIEFSDTVPRSSPKIYGDVVVWAEKGDVYWNIWGYDLSLQREFQITFDDWDQKEPNIWGDAVVWEDNRMEGDNWEIWGTVIPEPATLSMVMLGGILLIKRRR